MRNVFKRKRSVPIIKAAVREYSLKLKVYYFRFFIYFDFDTYWDEYANSSVKIGKGLHSKNRVNAFAFGVVIDRKVPSIVSKPSKTFHISISFFILFYKQLK